MAVMIKRIAIMIKPAPLKFIPLSIMIKIPVSKGHRDRFGNDSRCSMTKKEPQLHAAARFFQVINPWTVTSPASFLPEDLHKSSLL
jgi:hypothetical protein